MGYAIYGAKIDGNAAVLAVETAKILPNSKLHDYSISQTDRLP